MDLNRWMLPLLVLAIMVYSWKQKHRAYDSFVAGVKKGLGMFVTVYPNLLGMMLAIALLRTGGLMDLLCGALSHLIPRLPAEIWPMIAFRPISGSASLAILVDIFQRYGPDSLAGLLASVIQGCTDTTLYVLTLYFGSVSIRDTKHALPIGLIADAAGILAAIALVFLLLV